jgi:hypothetical protein
MVSDALPVFLSGHDPGARRREVGTVARGCFSVRVGITTFRPEAECLLMVRGWLI